MWCECECEFEFWFNLNHLSQRRSTRLFNNVRSGSFHMTSLVWMAKIFFVPWDWQSLTHLTEWSRARLVGERNVVGKIYHVFCSDCFCKIAATLYICYLLIFSCFIQRPRPYHDHRLSLFLPGNDLWHREGMQHRERQGQSRSRVQCICEMWNQKKPPGKREFIVGWCVGGWGAIQLTL